jgi:hypothetical protein
MAQRYGGKFSPRGDDDGDSPPPRGGFDGARVDPVGARANALFLPAIPLVLLSLTGGAVTLALGLSAAATLALAAFMLREGLRAEAAYDARRVARRPAFPRKMAASLLTGIGAGLASWWNDPGLAAALIFGLAATGLHVAAFGIDPLKDKGQGRADAFQQSRVARVVSEAEAYLAAMSVAIARAGDRRLEARVERFQATARDLIRTVEEDPRDLTAARRYLTVYLLGARDATGIFADIHARTRDPKARADYLALLDDLEKNFAARTARMLLDERSDLTVEIDVLRERLAREGVRPDQPGTNQKREP